MRQPISEDLRNVLVSMPGAQRSGVLCTWERGGDDIVTVDLATGRAVIDMGVSVLAAAGLDFPALLRAMQTPETRETSIATMRQKDVTAAANSAYVMLTRKHGPAKEIVTDGCGGARYTWVKPRGALFIADIAADGATEFVIRSAKDTE